MCRVAFIDSYSMTFWIINTQVPPPPVPNSGQEKNIMKHFRHNGLFILTLYTLSETFCLTLDNKDLPRAIPDNNKKTIKTIFRLNRLNVL